MRRKRKSPGNEQGFIMITALMILVVLTLMGLAVNRGSQTEWRIAMNDRLQKQNFYQADGNTELACELLEQNIACLGFNTSFINGNDSNVDGGADQYDIYINPSSTGFWRNFKLSGPSVPVPADHDGTDNDSRDFTYPLDSSGNPYVDNDEVPHTNFRVAGNTELTTGAAIQMAAGYEGRGKGLAVGGATLYYDINVKSYNERNSSTSICIKYQHVLGQEGDCYYP